MKTLQDIREDFMKQALEYDLGRSEEDFHSYLRHHNLEHHLSETQIRERNMENNKLNGLGMVMGIGVPLTLGAIYGLQKLTNNILIGHGEHNFREPGNIEPLADILQGLPSDYTTSLSGFNTRYMPTAPAGIDKDIITRPKLSETLRAEGKFKLPSYETDLDKIRETAKQNIRKIGPGIFEVEGKKMSLNPLTGEMKDVGISPPTSLL